jgi:hypothetical protein
VAFRQELGVQIRRGWVRPAHIPRLHEVHVRPEIDDDGEDVIDAHARCVHRPVKYLACERPFHERHDFPDVHRLREEHYNYAVRRRHAQELQSVPALVYRVRHALPEPRVTARARRTVKESENFE